MIQMDPLSTVKTRRLGFAGLGAMGFGMASNLLKKGFSVKGFDVSPKALKRFVALGGEASSSIRDASKNQNIVFVMVATPQQIDSLIFDVDGLISSLEKEAVLCLFSTLPSSYVTELKKRLDVSGRADIRLVECPVSGGVVGAMEGNLTASPSTM